MRAAFILHLFYQDVALELIEALSRLDRPIDTIVTTAGPPSPPVIAALKRLGSRYSLVETANAGRDVGPFLETIPLLLDGRYDVFCKLHTKRGRSGYATEWRGSLYESLVGSTRLIDRVLDAFAKDPKLAILGPARLFLSVAGHLPKNADVVLRLARLAFPGSDIPTDWGFFAGTMFWGRAAAFAPFGRLRELGVEVETDNTAVDGQVAHALERVFGLAGIVRGARFGLIEPGRGKHRISIRKGDAATPAPLATLRHSLMALKAARTSPVEVTRAADLAGEGNPLLHYIRHGSETDLDPNPYFHNAWYAVANMTASDRDLTPLLHYMREGVGRWLNPSPLFNTGHYLQEHPGLLRSGENPLAHFLETGRVQGRQPLPSERVAVPAKWFHLRDSYPRFDPVYEKAFRAHLAGLSARVRKSAASIPVSVILPVGGPLASVDDAIRSVLAQTHRRLELILVDFGTTGSTSKGLARHLSDSRVKIVRAERSGARSRGMAAASGAVIAYLDPGNVWRPDFLEVMTLFLRDGGFACAYCVAELRDKDEVLAFQGDQFDVDVAFERDNVALNAFCHERRALEEIDGLDETSPLAERDLILRATRGRKVGFAPFIGCEYRGVAALERLGDTRALHIHSTLLRERHRLDTNQQPPAAHRDRLQLTFAIKVPALQGPRYSPYRQWGDYHFADSLRRALERLGHRAFVDAPQDWYEPRPQPDDLVIAIRGFLRYEPQPQHLNILWNISRPEDVPYEEYESYQLVYVASRSFAALLATIIRTPVKALLQATDASRFRPVPEARRVPHDLLFVGNRRGADRPVLQWAIEEGFAPAIYGTGWSEFVPASLVRGNYVDNRDLAGFYAGARVVLNDHLAGMRDFGFVSNRVFDVLASGGKLVSDYIPTIERLFGNAVDMVRTRSDLRAALANSSPRFRARRTLARAVVRAHSFEARARIILDDVMTALSVETDRADADQVSRPDGSRDRPMRVHAVLRGGPNFPDDAAFVRLISPLTDETADVLLSLGDGHELDRLADTDITIVQIGAVRAAEELATIRKHRRRYRLRLIVDVDRDPVGDFDDALLHEADQAWFATRRLLARHGGDGRSAHFVPCGIDPRIWKDYSNPTPRKPSNAALRFLYVNRTTSGGGQALWSALDRLAVQAPDGFHVTYVGEAGRVPRRRWLRHLSPPPFAVSYPRFARWLRLQGPFDVGLSAAAKRAAIPDAPEVRILEYAAMGLLPVLSSPPSFPDNGAGLLPGIAAANNVEGWVRALGELMIDRRLAVIATEQASRVWEHATPVVASRQASLFRIALDS